MKISIVVAMGRNRVIGKDNGLPWLRIPADMKRFYELTVGKPVGMGRKTYESIISALGHPLPNRVNIVFTRDPNFRAPGCLVVHSAEEAIAAVQGQHPELMVIGGEQIFREFLSRAARIYLTVIALSFVGDTYFPYVNWSDDWHVVDGKTIDKGKDSPYNLWFGVFERYHPSP